MKTMFDGKTRDEVAGRIAALHAGSPARWGKMDVLRMLEHCARFDEWVLGVGTHDYRQSFLGRLFGRMALRHVLKDDAPLGRNSPAGAGFVVREARGDVGPAKARWARLVAGYGSYANPAFIHDFFGKMTEEQIGRFAYKHADHHLRQFGC